jgi:hypothetical protein
MKQYQAYFNQARPHYGINQHIPCLAQQSEEQSARGVILLTLSSVTCITTISGEQALAPRSLELPE